MTNVSVHDFQREVSCSYCGDEYLVRDNGAVFRKKRLGKRKRPLDEQWTLTTLTPIRETTELRIFVG